ncbi:MAG: alpha/beta hydrolase [Iphinoe sp. HA4291-MV1]|jgi:pimeloyl-ACP methyl ester carboxylesterase|nr:alpha/beta hydrolase [Iphinoe sp. HA4291-MV1]
MKISYFNSATPIFPVEQAKDATSHLKQGQLALIPNCGHSPQIECPELFTTALSQFLGGIVSYSRIEASVVRSQK